jgi:hypothetical protein
MDANLKRIEPLSRQIEFLDAFSQSGQTFLIRGNWRSFAVFKSPGVMDLSRLL